MACTSLAIQILLCCIICTVGQPFPHQDVVDATLIQTVLQHIKPILDGTFYNYEKKLQQDIDTRMQKMEDLVQRNQFLKGFGMLLDQNSLYKNRYMSSDSLTLFSRPYPPPSSNKQTRNENVYTHNWPTGTNQLQNYRGVIGTEPISRGVKVCFEIDLTYYIEKTLDNKNLVSEISLAWYNVVDLSHSLKNNVSAWTLLFFSKENSVRRACVKANNYTQAKNLGPSTAGTFNKIEIGIIVDTPMQTITYVDRQTTAIMCRHSNVNITEDLWLTFGEYNKNKVQVNMTLKRNYYYPDNSWIYV